MILYPNKVSVIVQRVCTYTEEEREEAMLGLDLELVIWGYLILEYSLSLVLFLCKVSIGQDLL